MLNWSNRRQGSCPQCRSPYSSRSTCSTCGYELGGSTSAKVPKLSCPLAVRVHGHGDLFSTRTSTRDDRCFVLKEGDFWICLHTECKNLRAMYVSSSLRTQTYFRLSLRSKRQPEIRLRSQAMYRATGLLVSLAAVFSIVTQRSSPQTAAHIRTTFLSTTLTNHHVVHIFRELGAPK